MGEKIGIKPQYGMVDIVKFFFALLIVTAHYITEDAYGRVHPLLNYGISVFIVVVPFFFCCAGFLLFQKVFLNPENSWKLVCQYCRRIAIMYGGWSLVYGGFEIARWIRWGTTPQQVAKYLLHAVFYSTYQTIWFLPALCIGVLLTYGVIKKVGIHKAAWIAAGFYLIGALGVSYSFVIEKIPVLTALLNGYNFVFTSTRNGFFNGFPFVFLGAYIARERLDGKIYPVWKNFALTAVFGICFVAEALVIKFGFNSVNANTLFFLVPFTFFFMRLCLGIPVKTNKGILWMRKMSTTIFLCQRLYLSAIPLLFPGSLAASVLAGNPYVGWAYVLIATVASAAVLVVLSKKNKLVSALC